MNAEPLAFREHRLGGGQTVGWIFVVVPIFGIVDVVRRGIPDRTGVATILVCLAILALSVLVGTRPVVRETPDVLVVQNLLRRVRVPWPAITDIRSEDVIVVMAGEVKIRCFALPRRTRRPMTTMSSLLGGRMMRGGAPATPVESPTAAMLGRLKGQASALSANAAPGAVEVEVDRVGVGLALAVAVFAILALLVALT